ncbi:hypothetical protein BRC64_11205 [Halobacteriales archaeon QH_10_67_22]|nr:MAG: hypothetical protein BRC64_11205 [Halobacteriales archaeon QH_10_67_22]
MIVKDLLTDPLTVAIGVATAVGHALGIKFVVAISTAVWTQLGTLFSALSIASWTLAPSVPWLSTQLLQTVALAIGGLYVLKRLYRATDTITERVNRLGVKPRGIRLNSL